MTAYTKTSSFSDFIRHDVITNEILTKPQFIKLSCSKNENILVDFVGRFEKLEADFEAVTRRIGLNNVQLERRNVSTMPLEKPHINEADRQWLRKIYALDYEMFGYV